MNKTPLHSLLKLAINESIKGLFTAQVGHIVSFDPTNQRAQVQIGVQRVDLDESTHNPPVINDVPVAFMGGSSHLEFQVNPNDEGLLVFIQRNIDGWKQTGGIAANPTPRIMQMQDCVFIHGVRSTVGAIKGFANDGIRMRSSDNHIWIKSDGTIVSTNANASVTIEADGTVITKNDGVTHTSKPDGSYEATNGGGFIRLMPDGTVVLNGFTIPPVGQGDASYDGTLKAKEVETESGIQLGTHNHGGVEPGGSNTGGPQ